MWNVIVANAEQARSIAKKYPFVNFLTKIISFFFGSSKIYFPFVSFSRSDSNAYMTWYPHPGLEINVHGRYCGNNIDPYFIGIEFCNYPSNVRYDIHHVENQFAETIEWINSQMKKLHQENKKWEKGAYV